MRIGEHRESGFAYVFLLVVIAVMGVAASASVQIGSTLSRRDAELQLLFVGTEFQQALRSYVAVPEIGGTAIDHGPRRLGELLKDTRAPGIRRHLRQLYADPLTGRTEWGLATDAHGCIIGIYSLAAGTPIKQSDFGSTWTNFDHARTYKAWLFGSPAAQAEFKLRAERATAIGPLD